MIGAAIPMALGLVPPNRWYGFRTPKTRASPDIWYPANRACGWFLIGAGSLALCFNLVLLSVHPDWSEKELVFWMGNSLGFWVLLAIIPSFLYLRRL
jgi:hypothetical protein